MNLLERACNDWLLDAINKATMSGFKIKEIVLESDTNMQCEVFTTNNRVSVIFKKPESSRSSKFAYSKTKEYKAEYQNKRLHSDRFYKRKQDLYCIPRRLLKGITKNSKAVGLNHKQFIEYLTKQFRAGMTMENYGLVWELSYKKPILEALKENLSDSSPIHYTNIYPAFLTETRSNTTPRKRRKKEKRVKHLPRD